MSHLSDLTRNARQKAGLSIKEAARRTGIKNEAKQIRVLQRLEAGDDPFPKAVFVERFAKVLGIGLAEIVQAMSLDYEEYEKWCDAPVKPYLLLRAVPGFYMRRSLPEDCTMQQAEEEARQLVQQTRLHVALVYKRSRAIYFQPDGCRFEGGTPLMQIGGTGRHQMAILKHKLKIPVEPESPRTEQG